MEGKQYLKLLPGETALAGLILPAISTITFYKGSMFPLEDFKARISKIVKLNPWLSGKLVKVKKETFLELPNEPFDVDNYFSILETTDIESSMSYFDMYSSVSKLKGIHVETGSTCRSKKLPLFKITILSNIKFQEFGLVVSLSHVIADGSTFYKVYSMLDVKSEPIALEFERFFGFAEEFDKVLPDCGNDSMPPSFGYPFRWVYTITLL